MPASHAYLGYAFVSNAERLKIPKNDVDEVKQRCLTFLVEATRQEQMRMFPSFETWRVSHQKVLKVQNLTSLASRFPSITNNVDDLNKEGRLLKVADIPYDLKNNAV